MRLPLNFKSGKPVYLQIVDQVKSAAASGAVRPGEPLPSIRPLAEELRVGGGEPRARRQPPHPHVGVEQHAHRIASKSSSRTTDSPALASSVPPSAGAEKAAG